MERKQSPHLLASTPVQVKRSHIKCPKFVVEFLKHHYNPHIIVTHIDEKKSAQQCVLILSTSLHRKDEDNFIEVNPDIGESELTPNLDNIPSQFRDRLKNALARGNDKIVLRIWKGSARWWNLNCPSSSGYIKSFFDDSVIDIARAEIAGYRLARAAFHNIDNPAIVIPEVLYFSSDNFCRANTMETGKFCTSSFMSCWAIFSYVGCGSVYFSSENINQGESNPNSANIIYDSSFASRMIKIRHEFGFNEPHPRHGRVDEQHSLEYAVKVLRDLILPIHLTFFDYDCRSKLTTTQVSLQRKHDMSSLCRRKEISSDSKERAPFYYQDMLEIYEKLSKHFKLLIHEIPQKDDFTSGSFPFFIGLWVKCVKKLREESTKFFNQVVHSLPPVLCHLDFQPQNLMFYRKVERETSSQHKDLSVPHIRCILDWEEAAFADPRFEILILCRKVCSNLHQANVIWKEYENAVRQSHNLDIGSLEPWLNLETVHSIITLLLQGMDRSGGGRNTWESESDLVWKIQREFCRLSKRGWYFCDTTEMIRENSVIKEKRP